LPTRCAVIHVQAAHVLLHLPFYMVVRPLRMQDWAWLVVGVEMPALIALLAALVILPAGSWLRGWWER
jgi:hypothetical protein